ncbi:hypothetical protein [Vibrio pectenicida]|uniref:Uncharacterized protein n=1 Tax=Vibrio pectenicida TaxID=62763 RepID=A0A427U175_9VIBR|nr:hypothetical protein [Vibrio pectenicida]RSD30398.1 hypothetical protein EJA03_14155 [Vibrio pectenicida]
MEKIAAFIGVICCCFGAFLCFYGIRGYIINDHSWAFVLVNGVSVTILGIILTVFGGYFAKKEHRQ